MWFILGTGWQWLVSRNRWSTSTVWSYRLWNNNLHHCYQRKQNIVNIYCSWLARLMFSRKCASVYLHHYYWHVAHDWETLTVADVSCTINAIRIFHWEVFKMETPVLLTDWLEQIPNTIKRQVINKSNTELSSYVMVYI